MYLTRLFFFVFLWGTGSPITVKDCPATIQRDQHLVVHGDKCYYFYLNLFREFDDAQKICEVDFGNLVTVNSQDINDFLYRELQLRYNFQGDVWIGLSDKDEEWEFEWRDGTPMQYANFEGGAGPHTSILDPSNTYQDCVVLKASDGKWTDYRCTDFFIFSNSQAFVCDYKPRPVTERTTAMPTTATATATMTTTKPKPSMTTTPPAPTSTESVSSTRKTALTDTTTTTVTTDKPNTGTMMTSSSSSANTDTSAFPKPPPIPTSPSGTCSPVDCSGVDCGDEGFELDDMGCQTCECQFD